MKHMKRMKFKGYENVVIHEGNKEKATNRKADGVCGEIIITFKKGVNRSSNHRFEKNAGVKSPLYFSNVGHKASQSLANHLLGTNIKTRNPHIRECQG